MTDQAPTFNGVILRGMQYRGVTGWMEKVQTLGLMLEREPTNQHHSNAVKVVTETNEHIAYIGREYADEIAPFMDTGIFFTCVCTGLHDDFFPLVNISPLVGTAKTEKVGNEELIDG